MSNIEDNFLIREIRFDSKQLWRKVSLSKYILFRICFLADPKRVSFKLMHTDLSSHLHTEECNNIIDLLRQCRIDNPLIKWVGKCNPEYDEMTKCLKRERLARRKRNYESSMESKERLNKIFKEQAKMKENNL